MDFIYQANLEATSLVTLVNVSTTSSVNLPAFKEANTSEWLAFNTAK